MEFLHASVALLASMVLILAGMVGWLYYQQTRLFQNMNSIVMVIGELAQPRVALAEYAPAPEEAEKPTETAPVEEVTKADDRVSVAEEAEVVDGPVEVDLDTLEGKSKKELQDLLTKKGIPFSRSDNKTALVNLLKATA